VSGPASCQPTPSVAVEPEPCQPTPSVAVEPEPVNALTCNVEALKELRRVCVEVPEERLHMRSIIEHAACGTAMCLFGWMVTDPYFRPTAIAACWFDFGIRLGVVADFLGISERNAQLLFAGRIQADAPAHSVTKAEVLWNIDELLAGRDARPYAIFGAADWVREFGPYAADREPPACYPSCNDARHVRASVLHDNDKARAARENTLTRTEALS
jgi:hypothetical protein